jgi:hypothetical protein
MVIYPWVNLNGTPGSKRFRRFLSTAGERFLGYRYLKTSGDLFAETGL